MHIIFLKPFAGSKGVWNGAQKGTRIAFGGTNGSRWRRWTRGEGAEHEGELIKLESSNMK